MYVLLIFTFIIFIIVLINFYHKSQDATRVLQTIVLGCLYRLQGVKGGDQVSNQEIRSFMTSGRNKLLVITSTLPLDFIYKVSKDVNLSAVALSSAIVNNQKDYIVLSIKDKKMVPVGSPTGNLSDALDYLIPLARKQLGPPQDTSVFFIDEDIPCPDPTPTKEPCCGKKF